MNILKSVHIFHIPDAFSKAETHTGTLRSKSIWSRCGENPVLPSINGTEKLHSKAVWAHLAYPGTFLYLFFFVWLTPLFLAIDIVFVECMWFARYFTYSATFNPNNIVKEVSAPLFFSRASKPTLRETTCRGQRWRENSYQAWEHQRQLTFQETAWWFNWFLSQAASLMQRAGTMSSISLYPLQGQGQTLPDLYPSRIKAAASGTKCHVGEKFLLTREETCKEKLQFSIKYGNRCLQTSSNLW